MNYFIFRFFVSKGADLNVCYDTSNNSDMKTSSSTLLNDAVMLKNNGNFKSMEARDYNERPIGCLEYLLQEGADVNLASVIFFISIFFSLYFEKVSAISV